VLTETQGCEPILINPNGNIAIEKVSLFLSINFWAAMSVLALSFSNSKMYLPQTKLTHEQRKRQTNTGLTVPPDFDG
jgi:hypothetical protein